MSPQVMKRELYGFIKSVVKQEQHQDVLFFSESINKCSIIIAAELP